MLPPYCAQQDAVWLEIEKKLMPHGRIMVNCGGAHAEMLASSDQMLNPNASLSGSWIQNSTVRALCRVFPGKVYYCSFYILICVLIRL